MALRAQRHLAGAWRDRGSPALPRTQVYKGIEGGLYLDQEHAFRARGGRYQPGN